MEQRGLNSVLKKYRLNAARCIDSFHVVEWINDVLKKVCIETDT